MAFKEKGVRLILALMFSRRWWWATLLILAIAALCIRLGFWQLSRQTEQSTFAERIHAIQAMPPLDLSQPTQVDLTTMEYRAVTVTGTYDFQNQVAIRNQYNDVQPGYHLLTPLRLAGGRAVLVDRGWIPSDGNSAPADWQKYDKSGQVTISGIIRLGQTESTLGSESDPTLTPNQTRLDFWLYVNMARLGQQMPYPLMPVYVQIVPGPSISDPPIPILETLDLSGGSTNLNYAIQWFSFSILFIVGYAYFLWRKDLKNRP